MDQSDAYIKSQEAAARSAAANNGDGAAVGAFAVAQAAPGGRRSGPRIRRTASQRRRARERAGLEPASGEGGGDGERGGENNVEELMAADVEFDEMILEESEDEVLGFWQLDKTDKIICGGIALLVLALIVILAMGMS
jgi:hypothetical protein